MHDESGEREFIDQLGYALDAFFKPDIDIHVQIRSPYSTFEEPFNFPHLGNSCGAVYTARWTALHAKELATSITEALNKRGLSMIEVLAPGPNFYRSIDGIEPELVQFYFDNSVVKHKEDPRNVAITPDDKIIVGKLLTKKDRHSLTHTMYSTLRFSVTNLPPTALL